METNAPAVSPVASADTAAVLPTASLSASVATPPITTIPPVPALPAYGKPFPDISRIELFSGQNYKRWQERIYSTLNMHGVAWYKQQLEHKQKQLSLGDLITHIIIEDTNRKEQKVAKAK